jgi:hypothetical protein
MLPRHPGVRLLSAMATPASHFPSFATLVFDTLKTPGGWPPGVWKFARIA